MMRILTIEDAVVRVIEGTKIKGDVRIEMMLCPEHINRIEDVKVLTMVISKKTFIKEMRKFLEELEEQTGATK